MGKLFAHTLPNQRLNFSKPINRMDPLVGAIAYTMNPTLTDEQLRDFPKDFFPTMGKKYMEPHVYKHVYVHPKKYIVHKKPTKKKPTRKEDSWLDSINPFGCDSDYVDESDYAGDYSESEELTTKRKSKLKYKKKKKKILVKILFGILVFVAVKILLSKFTNWYPTFVPTTGRDEFYHEDDALYEGLDIDRVDGDYAKTQDYAVEHRSLFAPNYEETRIDFAIPIGKPKLYS